MFQFLIKHRPSNKLILYLIFLTVWLILFFSQLDLYPRQFSSDINLYQVSWWNYLNAHGFHGIASINSELYAILDGHRHYADYTSIWYFIIVLFSKTGLYPHILSVAASIKYLGAIFTLSSSLFAYLIVKHFQKDGSNWNATLAASLIMFTPPFLGDILKTNLPDSSYISLILLSLLLFLKEKHILSWFMFGVAIYFKAMALYIAPLYIFYYFYTFKKGSIIDKLSPIFSFIGLVFASLPGYFAGLSLWESSFGTLLERTSSTISADNGFLSIFDGKEPFVNFPMIVPGNISNFQTISFLLMIVLIFLTIFLLFQTRSAKSLTFSTIDLTIVSPIIFWFFLPGQHENYFSLAAVFAFLAFSIMPIKKYFILFVSLNFLLWESFHFVPKALFNPYWFILIMLYLIWELLSRSEIQIDGQLIM